LAFTVEKLESVSNTARKQEILLYIHDFTNSGIAPDLSCINTDYHAKGGVLLTIPELADVLVNFIFN
jgi:hypothetical protein